MSKDQLTEEEFEEMELALQRTLGGQLRIIGSALREALEGVGACGRGLVWLGAAFEKLRGICRHRNT